MVLEFSRLMGVFYIYYIAVDHVIGDTHIECDWPFLAKLIPKHQHYHHQYKFFELGDTVFCGLLKL